MTNTNAIREDVLGYIAAIDDVALESEMAVTLSLMEAADKAMMIMENYDGEYIDSFSIFQEAAGDGKDPAHPFKEDGLLKTIVMAPINLIKLIIAKLKKVFGKEEQTKLQKAENVLKELGKTGVETFNSMCELLSGHKTEAVVLGTTITAGTALVISGKAKQAFESACRFTEKYLKTWMKNDTEKLSKDSYAPKIVLVEGKPAIETPIKFDALGKWLSNTMTALENYNMSLIKPGSAEDGSGGKTGDHNKITQAVNAVVMQVKMIKADHGYVGKKETIGIDEFRSLYADVDGKLNKLEEDMKNVGVIKWDATNPYAKELSKAARNFTDSAITIQNTITNLQEAFGTYSKYINATTEELSTAASRSGKSSIVDWVKSLIPNKNSDKTTTTDDATAKTADKGDVTEESAKITVVDEDYIQEGVTRTGKTIKVEETAKTTGDVEKLIKKYVANVSKKGFNNEHKILLVIGDSKIQYDKDKIKNPGKNETWDDVDMSAHDHVDNIKLYISGAGALAYAKENNIGKAKQVQESVLPEENEVEETVTVESAETSWYN